MILILDYNCFRLGAAISTLIFKLPAYLPPYILGIVRWRIKVVSLWNSGVKVSSLYIHARVHLWSSCKLCALSHHFSIWKLTPSKEKKKKIVYNLLREHFESCVSSIKTEHWNYSIRAPFLGISKCYTFKWKPFTIVALFY